jgi:hypothetical protein
MSLFRDYGGGCLETITPAIFYPQALHTPVLSAKIFFHPEAQRYRNSAIFKLRLVALFRNNAISLFAVVSNFQERGDSYVAGHCKSRIKEV